MIINELVIVIPLDFGFVFGCDDLHSISQEPVWYGSEKEVSVIGGNVDGIGGVVLEIEPSGSFNGHLLCFSALDNLMDVGIMDTMELPHQKRGQYL